MSEIKEKLNTWIDDLDPIFAECLPIGDEDWSGRVAEPWVRAGYVYATNGQIVVRQPTSLPDTTHKRSPPDASKHFTTKQLAGNPIALLGIGDDPGPIECPHCGGEVPLPLKAIVLSAALTLANRYIWLLQRNGIKEVRFNVMPEGQACYFAKGDIEGLVMGTKKKLP